MNQSAKVRAIYQELRQAVGVTASAAEILSCAASLVELFSSEDDVPTSEFSEERQPNYMLPVDVALANSGWRMLSREWAQLGWETSEGCGGRRPSDWLMI